MNRVSFTEDWQHKYHFWEYQKVIISTKYVHRININCRPFYQHRAKGEMAC